MRRRWRGWYLACLAGCQFDTSGAPPSPEAEDAGTEMAKPDAVPDGPVDGDPACLTMDEYEYTLDQRRYRLIDDRLTYDKAIARCAGDGAHLAVIDNEDENGFLGDRIPDPGGAPDENAHWIGLDDLTTEGGFTWVTGESTYENWEGTEPNDNRDGEDCAVMRPSGKWNDVRCGGGQPAICECDPDYRAPEMPACLDRESYEDVVLAGRRYRVEVGPAIWDDAAANCAEDGAHLAVIGDADENRDILGAIQRFSWIGYREPDTHESCVDDDPSDTNVTEGRAFSWLNGAPSGEDGYENWNQGAGQPNECDAHCAVISSDGGRWWDDECTREGRGYACECDPLPIKD